MENSGIGQALQLKIIRNTAFNIIGKFWGLAVSLLLTPYIIRHIGLERFGIWAMIGMVTGYFGMLDFGVNSAFGKYVAEYYTKKDFKRLNQVVNTGILFYLLFGVVVTAVSFLTIRFLLAFLNIPAVLYREALVVFLAGVIIFCFEHTIGVFNGILEGTQRLDLYNKITIALSLPMVVGTIFVLSKGLGLIGLMANTAFLALLYCVAVVIAGIKLLPELRFSPRLCSTQMLRQLCGFGLKVQVTRGAMLINYHIVKLLTSHFLTLGLVGFFELGQKIVLLVRDTAVLLVSALMPAAAEIEAQKQWHLLLELHMRTSKYIHSIAFPAFGFIFVSAPLIMAAWMGKGYDLAVTVIWILAPAYAVSIVSAVATPLAHGVGRPGIAALALSVTALLNIAVDTFLILKAGFNGVVLGTAVSLVAGSILLLYLFNRYLRSSLITFISSTVIKPLLATFVVSFLVWFLLRYYQPHHFSATRMTDLAMLISLGTFFACAYGVIILKVNFFDNRDRAALAAVVQVIFGKTRETG